MEGLSLSIARRAIILFGTILVPQTAQKSEDDVLDKDAKPEDRKYLLATKVERLCVASDDVLDGRRVLDARIAEMAERFGGNRIPFRPHWGGYRLTCDCGNCAIRSDKPV